MSGRLIETWLPIAALGEESVRERRSMTALPAPYYLHVWWARRPLVASRAAVLASLLPADADHQRFLQAVGIHGDPVASRNRIDLARRKGERFEGDAYSYPRAFSHDPTASDRKWIAQELARLGIDRPHVLDPTAGGGSIPFEAIRLGAETLANDLNPIAAMILRMTVEFPYRLGLDVQVRFKELAAEFVRRRDDGLRSYFPREPDPDAVPTNYLWARTIRCPYCTGVIPLSPTWRLAGDGTGVQLHADTTTRVCQFTVVETASEQSAGTVKDGDAQCPYADCNRVVDGDEVKRQAQAREMGDQLYAVVYKKRGFKPTKSGKKRAIWQRGYRAPTAADDVATGVGQALAERLLEWEPLGIAPTEAIGDLSNYDRGHRMYGMTHWRDLFSARQFLGHCLSVQVLRALVDEKIAPATDEASRAAVAYLASAMDKLCDYNSRMTRWHVQREVTVNTFDSHNYAMRWSYVEMAPAADGRDWAIEQTAKCIGELVQLVRPTATPLPKTGSVNPAQAALFAAESGDRPSVTVTNRSADALSHIPDATVDAVVMDPPYYDNVMYAELSDFFYVWQKRTTGLVYPDFFRRQLTDKDNEAVANAAKFRGQKKPKELAARDYQQRMAAIFLEARRVLKPDGVLTVMFTHKATGAWDALATGLLEAGFTITASWPVNTEAEGSLHIKDKAAANSTIFLVCRPRPQQTDGPRYWEDVEPLVASAVRRRIEAFEKAGIRRVDLYLSCFGPALEEFAKHWPLTRGQPRTDAQRTAGKATPQPADPYAVTPEDALDAARREVKKWKLDRLLRTNRHADLDAMTEWFVLAWDAFQAPEFPFDEALRLARVVGVDLEHNILGKLAEKKGSDVLLWDSTKRAAKGALGPPDGSRSMIDSFHHAAHRARTEGLDAAREQLVKSKADQNPAFTAALAAVLEVLPVSSRFTKIVEEAGPVADAASDFDVLEQLRRLAYADRIREPEQLRLWLDQKS